MGFICVCVRLCVWVRMTWRLDYRNEQLFMETPASSSECGSEDFLILVMRPPSYQQGTPAECANGLVEFLEATGSWVVYQSLLDSTR